MRIPIARIGLLLLLIIVLPTIFFSAYEVSNLYRNEQMIDSIYTRQLESVLFSINQHSDDVVSSWATDIDEVLKSDNYPDQSFFENLIQKHYSLDFLFLLDSLHDIKLYSSTLFNDSINRYSPIIYDIVEVNDSTGKKLMQYIKSGYRKIQPVDIALQGKSLFLFSTHLKIKPDYLCGLIVDTEDFINEYLGPKIQSVAQNTFFISVFDKRNGNEVYSNVIAGTETKNIEHKNSLWLFPDYELGIELKGETVEDMVQERTYYNILIIAILDLLLLLAAWFVYRTVRQEVKLAQLKSEFVSNVSHEIRTPLAIINMYSETLQLGRLKSDTKKQEYYKVINTETNRLSGIVNKILNFSKIESGKREYKFEKTSLNAIVEQVATTYRHYFNINGFECNIDTSDDLTDIYTDKEAVTDALINLIDNAIKYSDKKKQIDIITGSEKDQVYVEIKDYGIGINKNDQKFIFDKFYRVTAGDLAYRSKGSGIGLSIVKHIMDAHNGTIRLESIPGKGSRFKLYFPS